MAKTVTILTITYINPAYEPGKTRREITEVVGVVPGKTLDDIVKARRKAKTLAEKITTGPFEITQKEVPVL